MLSVIIIVKNESENLKRCLSSVEWADEIIVLDSGSTDNSVHIAKQFTEHVYSTDWKGYGIQKQRALERATGKWVLNLDADECVSESLKGAILKAIHEDKADAYRIPIRLNFYGRLLCYSKSPKRHVRLFKRAGAHYKDIIIHEHVKLPPNAKIGKIHQSIEHYIFQDLSHALYKTNRYSSYTASLRKKNKPPRFITVLLRAWWMFFRCYILQRGFLEGKDGFLIAVLNAEGSFYRGMKIIYPDKQELEC